MPRSHCWIAIIVMLAMASAIASPAQAEGALVVADVRGVGQSYGYAVGYLSGAQARAIAFADCHQSGGPLLARRCRVVATFRAQCFAYASVRTGLRGHGWAVGADLATAQSRALAKCRAKAADPETCALTASDCDR